MSPFQKVTVAAVILVAIVLCVAAQNRQDCQPKEGNVCNTRPSVSRGSRMQDLPRRQKADAERRFRAFVDGNSEFIEGFLDDGVEKLLEKSPPSPEAGSDQCEALDAVTTLTSKSAAVQPEVKECREDCYKYSPLFVYHDGMWLYVIQLPWWHQTLQWCDCINHYCSGKSACNWWWKGTCVLEMAKKKILVWFWSNKQIKWKWVVVKYPVGCCCVPWGYGKVW